MTSRSNIPESAYGVVKQKTLENDVEEIVEQIRNLGYAICPSGYPLSHIRKLSDKFEESRDRYIRKYGREYLNLRNELNTIRCLLTVGDDIFIDLAMNEKVNKIAEILMPGKYILNQQNGIINPPGGKYNQGMWHRDIPYQHFIVTRPIAINALFCIDDFTINNGATYIIPASHKVEEMPSKKYINNNAVQIEAKAGEYIILDCMLYHAGGINKTKLPRRAINHVYNIPFFKQQINIPTNIKTINLTEKQKEILGFNFMESSSVKEYLMGRDEYK